MLRKFVEDSLIRLGVERIDLIQLHCPPTEVYYRPELFELFERLKEEGKIRNLGVSVEKVEEALKAIEYDNVDSVQIIFNMFRQRPNELFIDQARKKNVGILARVPLASGLLTGKFNKKSKFSSGDHRNFNRNGEMFDKGETFSGIDYNRGLKAVEALRDTFPNEDLSNIALKWILMHIDVSCVIPGASRPDQVINNCVASDMKDLSKAKMDKIRDIYENYIKEEVHLLW
jgi:aryl-alcohol dehydrogenase-like predicted oxidoreductase